MKHPGPWTDDGRCIRDSDGLPVAQIYSTDPETRAILTHAAEMFAALKAIWSATVSDLDAAIDRGGELVDKINAEIAAAKGGGT